MSVRADEMNRVGSRPAEPVKTLEGLQNVDWKTEGQTKSGASMQRVAVVLQEMLQVFTAEWLTA